jgi:hypothetical protein
MMQPSLVSADSDGQRQQFGVIAEHIWEGGEILHAPANT